MLHQVGQYLEGLRAQRDLFSPVAQKSLLQIQGEFPDAILARRLPDEYRSGVLINRFPPRSIVQSAAVRHPPRGSALDSVEFSIRLMAISRHFKASFMTCGPPPSYLPHPFVRLNHFR